MTPMQTGYRVGSMMEFAGYTPLHTAPNPITEFSPTVVPGCSPALAATHTLSARRTGRTRTSASGDQRLAAVLWKSVSMMLQSPTMQSGPTVISRAQPNFAGPLQFLEPDHRLDVAGHAVVPPVKLGHV